MALGSMVELGFYVAVVMASGTLGVVGHHFWLLKRARKATDALPKIVPAKGGCVKVPHTWVEVKMVPHPDPGNASAKDVDASHISPTLVCSKCGFLGDGSKQMLNEAGLTYVLKESSTKEVEEVEHKEVIKRLTFDLSLYYDAWAASHKEELIKLLKDTNKVEELHQMLDDFLVEGTRTAQALRERIVMEIRAEAKRHG